MKGHEQRLLEYLERYGSITTLEAFRDLGNTRLSEYIRRLRVKGYNIKNEHQKATNRFGEKVWFDKYILKEDNEQVLHFINICYIICVY